MVWSESDYSAGDMTQAVSSLDHSIATCCWKALNRLFFWRFGLIDVSRSTDGLL